MKYKLELEFESDYPEDLVTRQIEKHIDSAIGVCLQGTEVDLSSVRIHTEAEITWLEKDYFILKKKDPRKTYQYYKTNLHQLLKAGFDGTDPDVALCRGVLAVLEDLFGKENLV